MEKIKELIPYIIIIIVVVLIRTFIATPARVNGESMDNTLKDGQILILKKYDKSYERFDIVVLNYNNERLIKRVIGLPGETVEYKDGVLYINGEVVEDEFASITGNFSHAKISEGNYLVLGDNRPKSNDSRYIGLISEKDILGTVDFRIFPFSKLGKIK